MPRPARAIVYEAEDVSLHGLTGDTPRLRYAQAGAHHEIACDFIAGCDGFHGVCRQAIPQEVIRIYERVYPFGWLGILADTPPVNHELIYTNHERGFALCTMRSMTRSRYYLQVPADEDVADWSDDRFWSELKRRLPPDAAASLQTGPSTGDERGAAALVRGRADASRPPVSRRRRRPHRAARPAPRASTSPSPTCAFWPRRWSPTTRTAARDLLDGYSARCLARVWKAQRFSWWMTSLTHRFPEASPFERRAQAAELAYIAGSQAAQTTLAENYVGLPFE